MNLLNKSHCLQGICKLSRISSSIFNSFKLKFDHFDSILKFRRLVANSDSDPFYSPVRLLERLFIKTFLDKVMRSEHVYPFYKSILYHSDEIFKKGNFEFRYRYFTRGPSWATFSNIMYKERSCQIYLS